MAVQFNGSTQGYFASLPNVTPNFTICMFVRPEQVASDRFKAIYNIGQTPFRDYHFIVWMDDDGSGTSIMGSYDDEDPDFTRIPFKTNQWYFIGHSEYLGTNSATSTAVVFVKQVGGPAVKFSTSHPNNVSLDPITKLLLGVDTFSEWGKSSICGVRLWNKYKSMADMEVESKTIRARDRIGLIGEYPLNYPEFRDYSGKNNHLSLDGSPMGVGTLVVPTPTNGPNIPQFYGAVAVAYSAGGVLRDVSVDETAISTSDGMTRDFTIFRNPPGDRITKYFID